jgi:hypothetical protein
MAKRPKSHPRRSRFKTALDSQEQLEEIELAQKAARKGKIKKRIDNTEKSRQRLMNSLRSIRSEDEAYQQYKP